MQIHSRSHSDAGKDRRGQGGGRVRLVTKGMLAHAMLCYVNTCSDSFSFSFSYGKHTKEDPQSW